VACLTSELIWIYGSYGESIGMFGMVMSLVTRPPPIQDNTNIVATWTQTSTSRVGIEPMIKMFERTKTDHALDRAANVIGTLIPEDFT
jgi:hypothetical protein